MLKVLTVCINGMGSSLILKMTVEKAFKELGIEADVKHCNASEFKGKKADVVITTPSLVNTIRPSEEMIVVTTKNFTDVGQIKEKISEALNNKKA